MFATAAHDPSLVHLAWRSLCVVAAHFGRADPAMIAAPRKGDEARALRAVWLYVASRITAADDERADWVAADRADRVVRDSRPLLSQVALSQISGLDRGSVRADIEAVSRWCARSGMIADAIQTMEDACCDVICAVRRSDDWLEEMVYELRDDRRTQAAARRQSSGPAAAIVAKGPRARSAASDVIAQRGRRRPALKAISGGRAV